MPPPKIKAWIEENIKTKPAFKNETQIIFDDDTTWEGLFEGVIYTSTLREAGLMAEGLPPRWKKQPKEVIIGNKVTGIGGSAFYNCTSLTSINIPNSVTTIDEGAFTECISLISIDIPESIVTINSTVFSHCTSLTTVNMPSIMEIKDRAFYGCTSLTTVNMPEICHIREQAFSDCIALRTITIPDSVDLIGIGANTFNNCYSLESVIFEGRVLEWVQAMSNYPWGITNTSIIKVA